MLKAPYYGVGFYVGDLYNSMEVGYPIAVFGYETDLTNEGNINNLAKWIS